MTPDFTHKLNGIFAAAYHAAALQEAEMQALATVLEPMRERLKESGETLETRAALDTAVGGNDDPQAEEALQKLRADFTALQKEMWAAEISELAKKSASDAWALFLHRYAEANFYWRTQLAWWWADVAAGEAPERAKPLFPDKAAELRRLQENSRYMEHARWPEAYPALRELAENQLIVPKLRAQLWTMCGSIQMYYNTLPDAEADLAEAEKSFPRLSYLTVCRADLERIAGRYERSREILREHLLSHPEDPEAHIALGRSFVEEKNWDEALRCFEDTIAADPGNSSGYRNKLSLWGKNEVLFAKNKEKIPEMLALADRADPESALSNLLEVGYAFQAGGDMGAAMECFEKTRLADPERLEPITAIGFVHQAEKRYEEAAKRYEEALQLAPSCVDGYWNLAGLYNEQGQFLEAAAWYEKALPYCPMFTRTLWVKASEMYIAAGAFEKAKTACLKSLEIDSNFDFALNTLHDLSDKLRNKGYDEKTGMEPALDILRDIRRLKGPTYEASFQNRSGNVYYYSADYQPAAEHYRKAIAADTSLAVYHDNLAGTLDKLYDQTASLPLLTEAAQAAEAAARLEPSNDNYRQQTVRLERKLMALRHFGVVPEERSADIFSVRVRFREELYTWLVKDGELAPGLLQKIETLRAKFKTAFGVTIPGIRFSTDWNIVEGANFVIDLDGIPMQQGWLNFDDDAAESSTDALLGMLEQNILFHLADFIHYDSPEVSAKFIGKSSFYAAGYFQVVRVLLKQKINISAIDTIHEIYESGVASRKNIQAMAQEIRCHSAILPGLPVNTAASRTLTHLTQEQERDILASMGKSFGGELLWQIHPNDPVFFEILDYLPKTDYSMGGNGHFVIAENPEVATLLSDLSPGTFFSRGEVLER